MRFFIISLMFCMGFSFYSANAQDSERIPINISGMIPPNLLTSGALNFDLENNFGRFGSSSEFSVGDLANLILVTSNPLENRNRIDHYDGVMIRGMWYNRESVLNNPEEVKSLYP